MPVRFFRCSLCDFESQDEKEVIEHEKTHVRQIECTKIHKKDEIPCMLNILERQNVFYELTQDVYYELTFTWDAVVTNKETARTMSSVFQVRKDAIQDVFGRNNE